MKQVQTLTKKAIIAVNDLLLEKAAQINGRLTEDEIRRINQEAEEEATARLEAEGIQAYETLKFPDDKSPEGKISMATWCALETRRANIVLENSYVTQRSRAKRIHP